MLLAQVVSSKFGWTGAVLWTGVTTVLARGDDVSTRTRLPCLVPSWISGSEGTQTSIVCFTMLVSMCLGILALQSKATCWVGSHSLHTVVDREGVTALTISDVKSCELLGGKIEVTNHTFGERVVIA